MILTPVKTPKLVKKMFPNFIWEIPTSNKEIYLTFDDGPTPKITNWVLNQLDQYQAKATFFCIGNNMEKHPDIFQNILDAGHAVGNHTHNHIKGWQSTLENYVANVTNAQSIIDSKKQQSLTSNLFRPPYGQITPKQGAKLIALGYKIIMWDVLSIDWNAQVTPQKCLQNVITKAKPGSIIVFHDSVKANKNLQYALPKVLAHFSSNGFIFKCLPN